MKIGSPVWRLQNYGFFPSIKYLYTEKINKQNSNYPNSDLITSLLELNNKLLKIKVNEIRDLNDNTEVVFQKLSSELLKPNFNTHSIKKSVIGNTASTTRLKILAYIIKYFTLDLVIESGTQHGISALVIESFVTERDCLVYSLDIRSNAIPEGKGVCNFVILDPPIRKSFKTTTSGLAKKKNKILFFHDSDHSYENMTFELDWAWNKLKVACLISDDISENMAFARFVEKNYLTPYYCKFDSGSVVGLVIRQL